jgi:hypothetical protein
MSSDPFTTEVPTASIFWTDYPTCSKTGQKCHPQLAIPCEHKSMKVPQETIQKTLQTSRNNKKDIGGR